MDKKLSQPRFLIFLVLNVIVIAGSAASEWEATKIASNGLGEIVDVVGIDLNGDQVEDPVILSEKPFSLVWSDGESFFPLASVSEEISKIAAADLNNDGALDLIAISEERAEFFVNENGVLTLIGSTNITGSLFTVNDYDQDGDPDLFTCDGTKIWWHEGQTDSLELFQPPVIIASTDDQEWSNLDLVIVEEESFLVLANKYGSSRWYRIGASQSSFSLFRSLDGRPLETYNVVSKTPSQEVEFDYNQDGIIELLYTDSGGFGFLGVINEEWPGGAPLVGIDVGLRNEEWVYDYIVEFTEIRDWDFDGTLEFRAKWEAWWLLDRPLLTERGEGFFDLVDGNYTLQERAPQESASWEYDESTNKLRWQGGSLCLPNRHSNLLTIENNSLCDRIITYGVGLNIISSSNWFTLGGALVEEADKGTNINDVLVGDFDGDSLRDVLAVDHGDYSTGIFGEQQRGSLWWLPVSLEGASAGETRALSIPWEDGNNDFTFGVVVADLDGNVGDEIALAGHDLYFSSRGWLGIETHFAVLSGSGNILYSTSNDECGDCAWMQYKSDGLVVSGTVQKGSSSALLLLTLNPENQFTLVPYSYSRENPNSSGSSSFPDFDNDGDVDSVAYSSSEVVILWSEGDEIYRRQVVHTSESKIHAVRHCRLENSQRLDLVVLKEDGVWTLRNIGKDARGLQQSFTGFSDTHASADDGQARGFQSSKIEGSRAVVQAGSPAPGSESCLKFSDATLDESVRFILTEDSEAYQGDTAEYTMMAWMKPSQVSGYRIIFGQPNGRALQHGIHDGKLFFSHYANDFESSVQVENDRWYHVAYTYADGVGRIFLNGLEVACELRGGLELSSHVYVGSTRFLPPYPFERDFRGLLDNIEFYNIALNSTEIIEKIGFIESPYEAANLVMTPETREDMPFLEFLFEIPPKSWVSLESSSTIGVGSWEDVLTLDNDFDSALPSSNTIPVSEGVKRQFYRVRRLTPVDVPQEP